MISGPGILQKTYLGIFLASLTGLLVFYWMGYDTSISWQIQADAHSEMFAPHYIQKGPFEFDLKGYYYTLAEAFSADPVHRIFLVDGLLLILIFFGLNTFLAVSTTLPRYWFIGIAGCFVFFLFNLRLDELGIFGFPPLKQYGTMVLFLGFLLPAYLFHAVWKVGLIYRILTINLICLVVFLFSGVEPVLLIDHLTSNGYYPLIILSLIYLLIICEENLFGVLFLVTKTKGGRHNERHFIFLGLFYLLVLGLYYGKKSGLISIDITFFDPYLLLAISSVIACWSLWYKQSIIERLVPMAHAWILFYSLGIAVIAFMAQSMFRGNDPVYEGYHYFILYTHLGFGVFFFFYIILNFINPLSNGLQVFKIAYHSQNFPYISAKLGGLVTITAFFFLAAKAPYMLFQSGHYNYQGAQARTAGNENLAIRYFEEGRIFGHDNHFSNYQLGHHHLERNELELANLRFYRATLRFPSPHAFINQSKTDLMLDNPTPAQVDLKTGLLAFPDNGYLTNNLGLLFAQQGSLDSARKYLSIDDETGDWNNANQTNYWMVSNSHDLEEARTAYQSHHLSVKANVLANLLANNQSLVLPLDTAELASGLSLHKGAYLVNYAWNNHDTANIKPMLEVLTTPLNDELYRSAKQAVAINAYLNGQVNLALDLYDALTYESANYWQGQFLNQKGLLALEQHALGTAEKAFSEAIVFGNADARLNLVTTFLESGNWNGAYELMDHYSVEDEFFFSLKQDITRISSGKDLVNDEVNFYAYYFYTKMEISDLSNILLQADTAFIESLWNKVKFELIDQNPDMLGTYLSVFEKYLDQDEIRLSASISDLMSGNEVASDQLTSLANDVKQNSLHPSLVIAVGQQLSTSHNLEAYDLLLKSMEMNEEHVGLIKAYIDESIRQGLLNYAESTLDKLNPLMGENEFVEYSQSITSQIAEIRSKGF